MNDPRERHVGFNAGSRDQWAGFENHRLKVSGLLAAGGDPGRSRLCILGAGNCNDLDLPAILQIHREVHLVDIDSEALGQGVARQGVSNHPALHQYGGIDLTGMFDAIARFTATAAIARESLVGLAEAPSLSVAPLLAGPYDVVASTCILSPLIGNAFHSIGESHAQFMPMVQALRVGHMRLMAELLAPGGTAILITDITSSDLVPELGSLPEPSLADLFPRLVRERSYFHGLNPEVLWSLFEHDPVLSRLVAGRESLARWRWSLHARVYLVWALRFRMAEVGLPRGQPGGHAG